MWRSSKSSKIFKGILIVVAIGVVIYTTWNFSYPSGSWRYKLTVEIETPEGVRTGSSVREIFAHTMPKTLPEAAKSSYSLKGEAVIVDLGKRGQVFALLRTYRHGADGGRYIFFDAFPRPDLNIYDRISYYKNLKKAKTVLSSAQYPVFVRFRDPNDLKTIEAVDPSDFAVSFGKGVQLRSVTIETTDEPVTNGMVERYVSYFSPESPMAISGTLLSRADFIRNSK